MRATSAPRPGMRRRSGVMLACALLLLAPAARAQSADVDPRIAARLDAETGRQVAQVIAQARTQRLPVEPLVDKALEGASKRAAGPQIVGAVRQLSEKLAEARAILGTRASDADVSAAAQALRSGLTPAALRRLSQQKGRATLAANLAAYHELIALRVGTDTAEAAVLALGDAGVTAEQLAAYQNEVAREIAIGGEPAMVAAVAAENVAGDRTIGANLPNASGNNMGTFRQGGGRPKRKP